MAAGSVTQAFGSLEEYGAPTGKTGGCSMIVLCELGAGHSVKRQAAHGELKMSKAEEKKLVKKLWFTVVRLDATGKLSYVYVAESEDVKKISTWIQDRGFTVKTFDEVKQLPATEKPWVYFDPTTDLTGSPRGAVSALSFEEKELFFTLGKLADLYPKKAAVPADGGQVLGGQQAPVGVKLTKQDLEKVLSYFPASPNLDVNRLSQFLCYLAQPKPGRVQAMVPAIFSRTILPEELDSTNTIEKQPLARIGTTYDWVHDELGEHQTCDVYSLAFVLAFKPTVQVTDIFATYLDADHPQVWSGSHSDPKTGPVAAWIRHVEALYRNLFYTASAKLRRSTPVRDSIAIQSMVQLLKKVGSLIYNLRSLKAGDVTKPIDDRGGADDQLTMRLSELVAAVRDANTALECFWQTCVVVHNRGATWKTMCTQYADDPVRRAQSIFDVLRLNAEVQKEDRRSGSCKRVVTDLPGIMNSFVTRVVHDCPTLHEVEHPGLKNEQILAIKEALFHDVDALDLADVNSTGSRTLYGAPHRPAPQGRPGDSSHRAAGKPRGGAIVTGDGGTRKEMPPMAWWNQHYGTDFSSAGGPKGSDAPVKFTDLYPKKAGYTLTNPGTTRMQTLGHFPSIDRRRKADGYGY